MNNKFWLYIPATFYFAFLIIGLFIRIDYVTFALSFVMLIIGFIFTSFSWLKYSKVACKVPKEDWHVPDDIRAGTLKILAHSGNILVKRRA